MPVTQETSPAGRMSPLLAVGIVVGLAVAAGTFWVLDTLLAAFVAIVIVVGLAMAVAAHDWEGHASFEERELARARKRAEKWERDAPARARDRARWEAHQARKAGGDGSR